MKTGNLLHGQRWQNVTQSSKAQILSMVQTLLWNELPAFPLAVWRQHVAEQRENEGPCQEDANSLPRDQSDWGDVDPPRSLSKLTVDYVHK